MARTLAARGSWYNQTLSSCLHVAVLNCCYARDGEFMRLSPGMECGDEAENKAGFEVRDTFR